MISCLFLLVILVDVGSIKGNHPPLWYMSDPRAEDIGQMYIDPSTWSTARSMLEAVIFPSTQMRVDCPPEACSIFNLTYWRHIKLFDILHKLDLKFALESESLCPEDCTVTQTPDIISMVISNVVGEGGQVDYIDMDEPLFFGTDHRYCGIDDLSIIADRVVNNYFSRIMNNHSYPPIIIGDTEPYPALSANIIIEWLQLLKDKYNNPLHHFHIDVDFHDIEVHHLWTKASTDLNRIRQWCNDNDLPFGITLNAAGYSPHTDKDYYDHTMKNIQWWKDHLGKGRWIGDRILYESWEPRVPHNTPDSGPNTGTEIVIEGTQILQP